MTKLSADQLPKVVILAGGTGSRLAEETDLRPKPMVEIGDKPLLWHILKHYHEHGFAEFVIALGYRGEAVKRFFLDYAGLNGNMTVDVSSGNVRVHQRTCEDWKVHLVDTGLATETGGRVKRLERHLSAGTFMLTYGDGVSDVDVGDVFRFHRSHGRLATVTAVRPPARFGGLVFEGERVAEFTEKPQLGEGWINGGFMVLEPAILDYLNADHESLESHVLERLARDGELMAYRHDGFWQCMDTLRDKRLLDALWHSQQAPWKTWSDA